MSKLTTYTEKDAFFFSGYIDLIFEHDDGVLLVDWKTDKNANSSSIAKHKRQLLVYKKMHSIYCDIPEEKIKACVIFVALRGGINTGKYEKKIEFADRVKPFATFEEHLKGVLEWKKDPAKFIKELIEKSDEDELHKIIKEKLEKSK